MPSPFSRTLRSLAADRSRGMVIGLGIAAAFLAVWIGWFVAARVRVFEVSMAGRLEVDRAVHAVAAEVAGRVVRSSLELGSRVEAGDVLLQLDAQREAIELREETARLDAARAQREAVVARIAAERRALEQSRAGGALREQEAQALLEEGELAATLAEEEAARLGEVEDSGLSELELLRAKAEAGRKRAMARVLALSVERVRQEQLERESDRESSIEELEQEKTLLDGLVATSAAAIERLDHAIARKRVSAPIAGTLGEVTELRPGAVVVEGQHVATVIPRGELVAVAEFEPSGALGRIRAGQPARLRFDGFAWSQYGSLAARVRSVASEPRAGGGVRVELAIEPGESIAVPLQHGMPLRAEIEVERVTPANLVLRAAGRRIGGAISPEPAPDADRADARP